MGNHFFPRKPGMEQTIRDVLLPYHKRTVKILPYRDVILVETISTSPELLRAVSSIEDEYYRRNFKIFLELDSDRQFYDNPVNFLSKNWGSYDEMDHLFS